MFVPDKVSVPTPVFVSPPLDVAIASAIVTSPTASTVKVKSPLNALPDDTSRVKFVPVSACNSLSADKVIKPDSVFDPPSLRITPSPPTPLPLTEIASPTLIPPFKYSPAPEATVVAPDTSPNPAALLTLRIPALTAVAPV